MAGTGTGTVQLISTSTVRAASPEEPIPTLRIELTPWDLQFLLFDYSQKGLLLLKPTHTHLDNTTALIHHLKTTLSRTLDFFSPLAGRLATEKHDNDDGTSSYFILCDNSGAEFTHAVAADGITIADVLDPVFVPESFFPLNGFQNHQGVSKPLLAVQVTELIDGIFIGVTVNHVVVDGTSFWHFFNSWSEISRGDSNVPNNPPILQRRFSKGTDPPIRFHLPDENLSEKFIRPSPLLVKERVFHFNKEKIAALKAKANAETPRANNNNNSPTISSLQSLLSHLWRSITRSRRHLVHDPEKEIQFRMYIGDRTRVSPPLPNHYFGNSIHKGAVTMRAGELLLGQGGLGNVALKMNEMIASQAGEGVVRNFLESWAKSPTILTLGNADALITGSSPRFNVYGTDFGWGMRPVAVRSGPGNKFDGKITIFPGKEEGSVVIEVCLLAETLEAMVNDSEFMDAVTV